MTDSVPPGPSGSDRNARLIQTLYTAIQNAKPDEIIACYADDAYFEDIAFRLHGKDRILEMWQFVCHGTPKVTFDPNAISANEATGSGTWYADYMFNPTATNPGRRVLNTLSSEFVFRNRRIVEHRDRSPTLAWAVQAFPFPKSLAVGSIEPLRRYGAARKLDKFINPDAYRFPRNLGPALFRPLRYMNGR
jgi:SnoaL-like domain